MSSDHPVTPRVEDHLVAFNSAVRSGAWDAFARRFAADGTFEVAGIMTVSGREAIAAAYRDNPPDDTMTAVSAIADGPSDVVRFAWDRGGSGTMRLTWTDAGELQALVVAFD